MPPHMIRILKESSFSAFCFFKVSHLLVDLGSVDFDLGVLPSGHAAQPLLPNYHLPMNWADSGALKIQVNPTQSTSRWDILYTVLVCVPAHPVASFHVNPSKT